MTNPRAPQHALKKIKTTGKARKNSWRVKIMTHKYRAIGEKLGGGEFSWYFFGTHPEYDKFLS